MNRTMLVAIATLLALPALSGCLGGDEAPKKDTNIDCPDDICGEQKTTDTTGCIVGAVKNQDFQAITGAEVTLRELDVKATTAAEGTYSFCSLEPKLYTLYALAAGHELQSKEVTVVAGESVPGDFLLVELPPAAEPYQSQILEQVGFMGCAIASKGFLRGDSCSTLRDQKVGSGYPLQDKNARNHFYPLMDSGLTAIAMALKADTPPPGTYPAQLIYKVWWENPPGGIVEPMVGPNGVEKVQEFETADWQSDPRGKCKPAEASDPACRPTPPAHVIVELDNAKADLQFTAQHKFTLYLVFFYNGQPVPSGFSARPDA